MRFDFVAALSTHTRMQPREWLQRESQCMILFAACQTFVFDSIFLKILAPNFGLSHCGRYEKKSSRPGSFFGRFGALETMTSFQPSLKLFLSALVLKLSSTWVNQIFWSIYYCGFTWVYHFPSRPCSLSCMLWNVCCANPRTATCHYLHSICWLFLIWPDVPDGTLFKSVGMIFFFYNFWIEPIESERERLIKNK